MAKKLALLSVSDKTGLEDFARFLVAQDFELLSTGGTKKSLEAAGIPVTGVSDYTGSPEILEGRVKTLHPKIHGGLLVRTSLEQDLRELASIGGRPIEVVVVNLYPFLEKSREAESKGAAQQESLVEFIDIGGPAMLRASAKNFAHVTVVCDPRDYAEVMAGIKEHGTPPLAVRRSLAAKVFTHTASYDTYVSRYLSLDEKLVNENGEKELFAPTEGFVLTREQSLRYGENPHQGAALYRNAASRTAPFWKQLQGKELSYNNLVDLEAALELALELEASELGAVSAVIIKHTNPCGSAIRANAREAFLAARECDPVSAFGGIIALTAPVEKETADSILEGFVEVILAPSYTADALQAFSQKKNIRVLEIDFSRARAWKGSRRTVVRNFFDGVLIQQADSTIARCEPAGVKTEGRVPYTECSKDLEFAWRVSKHVKSNAIVLAKDLRAFGVGAGQMSRLDSARIALERARAHGFQVEGSVAGSDAFLPFPDTLQILAEAGVVALAQPGGSMRDEEVIQAAKQLGVTMIFTGERHFRH